MKAPSPIERRLGHIFYDRDLLQQALTHKSFNKAKNNERLEFLGDAILGCVIGKLLYEIDRNATEGRLSQMRTRLVRGSTQIEIAKSIGLEEVMLTGKSFSEVKELERSKAIGSTLEALLGAIFIDGGYDATKTCIHRLFGGTAEVTIGLSTADLKDSKTYLQEFLAHKHLDRPHYSSVKHNDQRKEESALLFSSTCKICWLDKRTIIKEGSGITKKFAEQAAAEQMLLELMRENG